MRKCRAIPLFLAALSLWLPGCSGVGSPADSSAAADNQPVTEGQPASYGSIPGGTLIAARPQGGAGANALSVLVGPGAICDNYSAGGTLNQPCTSVTICVPGSTTQCQTVSDILVDTGSYGLRVFASALYQNLINGLAQLTDLQGNPVAECAQFGTGQDWGPVMTAGIQLGTEPVAQGSIQVINRSFSYAPGACSQADKSPEQAGFNGILGVGLLQYDCGPGCVTQPGLGNLYFSCSGVKCSGTTVGLANQIQNPVAMLPADNNGVILSLNPLSGHEASSVSGTLYLGIGTESNNSPGSVTTYFADSSAEFITTFNGTSYKASFIDSGSNVLFVPDDSLSVCDSSSSAPGFFCPSSTQAFSATNQSVDAIGRPVGSAGPTVDFSIANASDLVQNSALTAFDEIGADSSSSGFSDSFDWGLPFFFGRQVSVGMSGARSTLGTGPYWAY